MFNSNANSNANNNVNDNFNSNTNKSNSKNLYQAIEQTLQHAGITLSITRKRVKNINFRLKPNHLAVSAPKYASDADVIGAIHRRIDWVISQHAILLKRIDTSAHRQNESATLPHSLNHKLTLWGEVQSFMMGDDQRIDWYRSELKAIMPQLFAKWQPIVGKVANETRIKKMKTRWGTCNTQAKRVWLSVYLPAYPIQCTEYVIVHELCHLHHANHSPQFWVEVKRAMPDYQRWHDMLAGKSGSVD